MLARQRSATAPAGIPTPVSASSPTGSGSMSRWPRQRPKR